MDKSGKKKRMLTAVVMFVAAVIFEAGAWAKQPEQIEKTVQTSVDTRKGTQEKAKTWHAEKDRLKSSYFQLKEEIEEARLEANRMKELVDRQDAYIARMNTKLVEMEKIRQGLLPHLEEVLVRLEKSIAGDLPFLPDERKARLENLRAILYDPEVTLGEKFRRVFEGLRVEMEYGRSVEVSKEEIDYQGEKLLVNVLRIGRTALLMQTLDEQDVALYHNGWQTLPQRYGAEVKKAIDIAQRKRPVEFVNIPVKAVAE